MSTGCCSFQDGSRTPDRPLTVTLIGHGPSPWLAANFSGKAMADVILSFLLLLLAIPIMAVAAMAIKLGGGGPVLFRQTRTGKNGRPFVLFKFRTMRVGSEQHGACWSPPGDPRVTSIGRFLRRTHADELPQLWNVVRGDMSLVGPRPERPEFVLPLMQALPRYGDRLMVRPGMTGLAQVQLPADTDLESVRRKLTRDLYYVEHASLWLDIRILLATALKILGIPFVVLTLLFRLPRPDAEQGVAANTTVTKMPLIGSFSPAAKETSEASV